MRKVITVFCCLLLLGFISYAQTTQHTSLKQMKWLAVVGKACIKEPIFTNHGSWSMIYAKQKLRTISPLFLRTRKVN